MLAGKVRRTFRLRDELVRVELLGAFGVEFGQFESRLRIRQIGDGAGDGAFVSGGINLRQHIALLDLGVKVHFQFRDDAGDLAADGDRAHRIQRPIGGDRLRDVAFGDGAGFEFHRRFLGALGIIIPAGVADTAQNRQGDDPFQPA